MNPPPASLLQSLKSLPGPVWVLYSGTFINRLGTFVVPFLALYLVDRGFSATQAGFAVSAYGVGHLFASIIGGHLADTIGRRKTILISMVASAATMLALSQAERYPMLLLLACLAGLATEVYRPASSALLTDLVEPGERVTAFAGYRIAINAGFAIGPALAGWMAEKNFMWLFAGNAATSLIFGLITFTALPAGLRLSEAQKIGWRDSVRVIGRDARFIRVLTASFLVGMIFMQMSTTFGLEVERHGHPKTVFGWVLSWNGILIVLCELPLTLWTRRFPTLWMMSFGYLLCGLGFGMNALGGTTVAYLAAMTVFTFGEMISLPVGAAYVAGLAPAELRGRYMGANGLTWAAALIVGPSAGMALFAWKPTALWLASAACGMLAAGILAQGARRTPFKS